MYGNTHAVADAIAEGIGSEAEVRSVHEAGSLPAGIDLLVVGGPTHMHGLSSGMSRKMSASAAKEDGHARFGAFGDRGARSSGVAALAGECFVPGGSVRYAAGSITASHRLSGAWNLSPSATLGVHRGIDCELLCGRRGGAACRRGTRPGPGLGHRTRPPRVTKARTGCVISKEDQRWKLRPRPNQPPNRMRMSRSRSLRDRRSRASPTGSERTSRRPWFSAIRSSVVMSR